MIIVINLFVISVLVALFLGWLIRIILSAKTLHRASSQLSSCQDIEELEKAIEAAASCQQKSDVWKIGHTAWNAFVLKHNLAEWHPLDDHIKAIFKAGLYESRLEAQELLQTTTERFFKASGYIKQVLSSFIVIGLLGTLFGLAYSLHGISAKINYETMLEHLWIAFVPSIGGVFFTILGTFIYIFYTHFFCLPLRNKLYEITVTNFIPKLIPAFSQRSILKKIDCAVDRMFKYSETMNTAIDAFGKDIERLSDFQQEMARLITLFKENFERQDSYQRAAHESVLKQGAQMEALLEKVGSIGKGYLESMDKTVSALRQPFLEQMEELTKTSARSIDKVSNTLQRMELPLKETAQSMRESVYTLDLRMTAVLTRIGSLQADMGIKSLSGELKTLNENIVTLLSDRGSKTLVQHIKRLFGRKSDTNL